MRSWGIIRKLVLGVKKYYKGLSYPCTMKLKLFLTMLLGVGIFFTGLVWADTNGVWHDAEDVRAGTFGADEGDTTTPYVFNNPVQMDNTLQVEKIEAPPGKNLVIQLG